MIVGFVLSMILSVFLLSGVLLNNTMYSENNYLYCRGYKVIMFLNIFFISSIRWVKYEIMVYDNIIK